MEHPVRLYRRRLGLSLEAFAALVQVTKSTISRVERQVDRPSSALIQRLIEASGGELTADDLIAASPIKTPGRRKVTGSQQQISRCEAAE